MSRIFRPDCLDRVIERDSKPFFWPESVVVLV
jgi:hypothetical protein